MTIHRVSSSIIPATAHHENPDLNLTAMIGPVSPGICSAGTLDRIVRLQRLEEPAPEFPERTTDPTQFFGSLETEMIGTLFNSESIANFYKILDIHPINPKYLRINDLLGLEFYRVLSKLKDSFLDAEKVNGLIEEWRSMYIEGYTGLIRTYIASEHPISDTARIV